MITALTWLVFNKITLGFSGRGMAFVSFFLISLTPGLLLLDIALIYWLIKH